MENIKHSEQNIKVEITKKKEIRLINVFCKNLGETPKERGKKFRVSFVRIHIA